MADSKYPLVSVVIPAYNSGGLLVRCLESVGRQTWAELECVVVDDGSTDGSVEAARDRFADDSRFRFIRQRNCGVSAARNRGLAEARGRLLCFIDSDDYVDPDYVERMHEALGDADLAVCGLVQERANGCRTFAPESKRLVRLDASGDDAIAELLEKYLLFGPMCKLYKTEIIRAHGVDFPPGLSYGEDLVFNFRYLAGCRAVATMPCAPYHYVIREGSLSNSAIADYWETNRDQWLLLRDFVAGRGLEGGSAERVLYGRLAGIVCDSVFMARTQAVSGIGRYRRIRDILSFRPLRSPLFASEVEKTGNSRWIKFCLRHRMALPFVFAR